MGRASREGDWNRLCEDRGWEPLGPYPGVGGTVSVRSREGIVGDVTVSTALAGSNPRSLLKSNNAPDGHLWCTRCERYLNQESFSKTKSRVTGRQAYCRSCYQGGYSGRPRVRRASRGNREFVRHLKESTACKDCKGLFPACVMDFDHIDANTKVKKVSLLQDGSKERLLLEISKCEIVCANCHRIRSWKRLKRSPSPD